MVAMFAKVAAVFGAGAFCTFAATAISSVLLVVFWAVPAHAINHWYEVPRLVAIMCLYAFIPAGMFGFLCGILGRSYLLIRTRPAAAGILLLETSVVGGFLGSLFPLLFLAMRWEPRGDWLSWKGFVFSAAVGFFTALSYAVVFRESLNRERSVSSSGASEPC